MRRGDAIVYGTNLSEDKEPRKDFLSRSDPRENSKDNRV